MGASAPIPPQQYSVYKFTWYSIQRESIQKQTHLQINLMHEEKGHNVNLSSKTMEVIAH